MKILKSRKPKIYNDEKTGLRFVKKQGREYGVYSLIDDNYNGEIIIPSTFRNRPVTSIEKEALSCDELFGNSYIGHITIPSSIIYIGEHAFYVNDVFYDKNIYYQGSLSEWCKITFENEESNPLKYANDLYTNGVKLEGSLVIPSDVSEIRKYTFAGYKNLLDVVISDGVKSIGIGAFYDCTNIKSVTISDTVTIIEDCSFSCCTSLEDIYYQGSKKSGKVSNLEFIV